MITELSPSAATVDPSPLRDAERIPLAWRPVLLVVAARSVLLLAVAGRYGWHRDELYYFAAGKHLSLGYVDYPPITALLSAVARVLFGSSLVGQRSFAIAAGAGVTVLAAAIARQLGGGRRAQLLAALAIGLSPMLLGSNVLFQTVSFDQLTWAALFLCALRVAERPTLARWAVLGAVVGVACETKYTALMPIAVLTVTAYALAPRSVDRDRRGPWLALAIALVLFAPNLIWQVQHDWASVQFFHGAHGNDVRAENPPLKFVVELLLIVGPICVWLSVTGFRRLWRNPATRAFALAAPLVVLGFIVAGGKSYYAAPIVTLLVPAGAVAWEQRAARRARPWVVPVALLLIVVPLLPIGIPILPTSTMLDLQLDKARPDYAEELGWPQLVDTVARAYRTVPVSARASIAILTENYGEAGAIDLYGPSRGLPHATSRHLSYALWSVPRGDAHVALAIGFSRTELASMCSSYRVLAVFPGYDRHMKQDEKGSTIVRCELPGTVHDVIARGWQG